jgi:putative phage-type endonuclease
MLYEEVVDQHKDFSGWQAAHATGIGGSEIAAVLGESRWKSRLRVWGEKTNNLEHPDLGGIEAVEWGLLLEPVIAKKFQQMTDVPVEMAGVLLRSVEHPWAIVTPDYWTIGENGEWNIPVQIKATSAYMLKDWLNGAPWEVQLQEQMEMFVTGAPYAYVAVLVGGSKFMWAKVMRDEAIQKRIADEGYLFWTCVETNTWPDVDSSADASDAIADLFPTATGESIQLPYELQPWMVTLGEVKEQLKTLEGVKEEAENHIKVALGPNEMGYFSDGSGFSWKEQSRFGLGMAEGSVPKEEGAKVEAIVKKSTFRVLRGIQAKE